MAETWQHGAVGDLNVAQFLSDLRRGIRRLDLGSLTALLLLGHKDPAPMSTFRHSREIPAKPEAVFEAFRDPACLARWWGPDGFTNSFDTFEFRPGGQWLFTMHGPDGANYPNQSEFLEIVPHALIRIKHPEASARVRAALDDPDAAVRESALTALNRIGARGVSAKLASMAAADPDVAVRRAAATALARRRDVEGGGDAGG